jgi:putative transposase
VALSYETVRRWVNHFGPMIAADLPKRRLKPHGTWHLDEAYLKIDGRMVYLWRAVDAEGEFLDVLIQSKRNKHAALKLMRKLEEICLRPQAIGHRRFAIIQRRGPCPWDRALPRARAMDEQSSREFASADAAAGAQDAAVQEHRLSAEIPVDACGGLQHLQRPTPSHLSQTHHVLRAAAMDTWRTAVAAA